MKGLMLILLLAGFPAMAETLPEPPRPPERVPGPDVAPTPNADARFTSDGPTQQASVELKMFQRIPTDNGVAFTPGSRFRTPEERKPIQTPGISVTVPLQ